MGRGNFSLEASWGKFVERTPVIYLSLGLIAIGGWLLWRFPGGYFWHSIGEAAIIAALLMFLVDPFLRARLLRRPPEIFLSMS
jgi:membrane protein implicated in regulation of membrane protease activity